MWLDNGCVTHPSNGAVTQILPSSLSCGFVLFRMMVIPLATLVTLGDIMVRFQEKGPLSFSAWDIREQNPTTSPKPQIETLWGYWVCSPKLEQLKSKPINNSVLPFMFIGKPLHQIPADRKEGVLVSSWATTNYHKFKGLKQCAFIVLEFCRSEVQNGLSKIKMSAWLHFF